MNYDREDRRNPDLVAALCHELNALAKHQEDAAAEAASRTPSWVACPPSVEAHRIESESRPWAVAS